MNARNPPDVGWFEDNAEGTDTDDGPDSGVESTAEAIRTGNASQPRDWPALAVSSGFVATESEYYERLREATIQTARAEVEKRESADDQQLIHAIRALDDCQRTTNELTERVAEWATSHDAEATVDVEYVHELATHRPETPAEAQLVSLASRVVALDEEVAALRAFVEQSTPEVAPNLSALAGPVLAARLIALAGGLEDLAKQPAGTVQVLGAEDALFAHLRGGAPSPKHGIIYMHEFVRGTPREHRGSAARALAGKLTIGARIDHYSGDYRPELEAELDERMERIRARDSS